MTETEAAEWKTAADLAARRAGFLRDVLGEVPDVGTLADRALYWLAFVRLHAPPLRDSDVVALVWAAYLRLMLPMGKTLTAERLDESRWMADHLTNAVVLADHYALLAAGHLDTTLLDNFSIPYSPRMLDWMRRRYHDDETIRKTSRPPTDRELAVYRVMDRIATTLTPRDEHEDLKAAAFASKEIDNYAVRSGAGPLRLTAEEVVAEVRALWYVEDTVPAGMDRILPNGRRCYSVLGLRDALRRLPEVRGVLGDVGLDSDLAGENRDGERRPPPTSMAAADGESVLDAVARAEAVRSVRELREALTRPGERAAFLALTEDTTIVDAAAAEECSEKAVRYGQKTLIERGQRALRNLIG